MESFLKLVAADLYKHTEGNLAHTAVVFPNKRAGLFFNEYLAQESESPIWSPAYVSISELFRSPVSYTHLDVYKRQEESASCD